MSADLRDELLSVFSQLKKSNTSLHKGFPISHGEFLVLLAIKKIQEKDMDATVTNICDKVDISMPGVSQALNSLEKHGYIERAMSKSDRRKVTVSIKEDGLQLLSCCKKRRDDYFENIINKIGENDIKELIRIMKKIALINK